MTDADYVLYDGECVACHSYVSIARLKQLHPGLEIMNARGHPALVAELRRKGYEINEGMVLCLGGRIHFGAEATHMIAVLGQASRSRWRRGVLAFFGTAPWSRALYPWLTRGRLLLLRLRGRRLIGG
jgi:predicted DCC family thiol-disulfide oxidoreductase YuxK